MERAGSEKIGPYMTDVYEDRAAAVGPNPRKRRTLTTRVWLSRDFPAPVKIVIEERGRRTTIVLTSARFDVPIPPTLFELPEGKRFRAGSPSGRPAR
jgi:hypothetical protein